MAESIHLSSVATAAAVVFAFWLIVEFRVQGMMKQREDQQRRAQRDRARQERMRQQDLRQLRLIHLIRPQQDRHPHDNQGQFDGQHQQARVQPDRGHLASSPAPALPPYEHHGIISYSVVCENCRNFFRRRHSYAFRTFSTFGLRFLQQVAQYDRLSNTHSRSLFAVRQNATTKGCSVCTLISRNFKNGMVSKDMPVVFEFDDLERDYEISSRYVDLWIMRCNEYGRDFLMAWDRINNDMGGTVQETNDSDVSRNLVRQWHSHCLGNHKQCDLHRASGSRRWRPTRLISFAASPTGAKDEIKLVDGASLPDSTSYVALSYCWGKVHALRLLASTEVELRSGYPVSRLHKTFREAIQVCRWLGYHKLWIDSLCIIQDSAEDWQAESHKMRLIYAQSVLTIAAAHAKDPTKGLFVSRDPKTVIPAIVRCNWRNPESVEPHCVIDVDLRHREIDRSPLASRAWTIQERVLSPRTLSFGKSQIFFQCQESEFCESFPESGFPYQKETKVFQIWGTRTRPEKAWHAIVKEYSTARLTKETDRVLAIAGVAEVMQERLRDDYLAGLWRNNLPIEMLWSASQPVKPRPEDCIAPTWSWLSVNSSVDVMTQVNPHHFRKSLITITSANVDLVDPSYPTGNIYTGGTLQVKGRLKPAEWDLIPSHCAYESQTYQVTCEGFLASRHSLTGIKTEKPDLWTDVDTLSPGLNKLKISLLPIAVFIERQDNPETPAPVFVEGLVLTLKDPAARKYERVGRFSAAERLAAYLFLNGLPKEKTKASSEHHQKRIWEYRGKVEGFSFQGTRKWTRIPESDIVIV